LIRHATRHFIFISLHYFKIFIIDDATPPMSPLRRRFSYFAADSAAFAFATSIFHFS
jgi:hypothetical protein